MANKISDEQLEKEIAKILKNANLAKISTKKVIQKLEKIFHVELREKKEIIDKFVMDYVNSIESEEEAEESEENEDDEDAKPIKPKPEKAKAEKAKTEKKKPEKAKSERKPKTPVKREAADSEEDNSRDSDWTAPKPKKAAGYTRAYKLSPALSSLMGEAELPRHEVVKRVWAMIKEKNLYDPSNKQFAICDEALLKVIGTKRFRTFGMMKYLKTHFLP